METIYQQSTFKLATKNICVFSLLFLIGLPLNLVFRHDFPLERLGVGIMNNFPVVLKWLFVLYVYSFIEAAIKSKCFKAHVSGEGLRARNVFGKMVSSDWGNVSQIKKDKFSNMVKIKLLNTMLRRRYIISYSGI